MRLDAACRKKESCTSVESINVQKTQIHVQSVHVRNAPPTFSIRGCCHNKSKKPKYTSTQQLLEPQFSSKPKINLHFQPRSCLEHWIEACKCNAENKASSHSSRHLPPPQATVLLFDNHQAQTLSPKVNASGKEMARPC